MWMDAHDSSRTFRAKRRPGWELPPLHSDLELASQEALEQKKARSLCPTCNKSRSLYCYDCLVPLTLIPQVSLPIKVHVVLDRESRSKNTGVQAAILAPGCVDVHGIDSLPDVEPSQAVLLFPNESAAEADALDLRDVKHVFIIDSKWKTATSIAATHPTLNSLKTLKLKNIRTAYWRFHTAGVPDVGVCTVEAIWALCKEFQKAGRLAKAEYPEHCFDNLLWYFAYQHRLIQNGQRKKQRKSE